MKQQTETDFLENLQLYLSMGIPTTGDLLDMIHCRLEAINIKGNCIKCNGELKNHVCLNCRVEKARKLINPTNNWEWCGCSGPCKSLNSELLKCKQIKK